MAKYSRLLLIFVHINKTLKLCTQFKQTLQEQEA